MASVSGVCDSTYNTASDVVLTDGCMVPPSADPHLPGAPSPTASASTSSLVPPVSSMDASCDGSGATTAASQPSAPMQNLEEQWEQIKAVQGLIERCLQQHMNQAEVVAALQVRANIDPSMTNLVWQKLEEQNPDFFQAYKIQLRLKDQIMLHNCMVQDQINVLMAYNPAMMGGTNLGSMGNMTSMSNMGNMAMPPLYAMPNMQQPPQAQQPMPARPAPMRQPQVSKAAAGPYQPPSRPVPHHAPPLLSHPFQHLQQQAQAQQQQQQPPQSQEYHGIVSVQQV